jgi:hypothetical protein
MPRLAEVNRKHISKSICRYCTSLLQRCWVARCSGMRASDTNLWDLKRAAEDVRQQSRRLMADRSLGDLDRHICEICNSCILKSILPV